MATNVRVRKYTEKGREYNLSCSLKSRSKYSKIAACLLKEIQAKLGTLNVERVCCDFREWEHSYNKFLDADSRVKEFLPSEDYGEDEQHVQDAKGIFLKFKHFVERWISEHKASKYVKRESDNICIVGRENHSKCGVKLVKDPIVESSVYPDDSISNVSSNKSSSSVMSRISLAKAKEEQKRAEALTRIALLKKKKELEQARLDIKHKEEELELTTDIRVAEIRKKVLENLEDESRTQTAGVESFITVDEYVAPTEQSPKCDFGDAAAYNFCESSTLNPVAAEFMPRPQNSGLTTHSQNATCAQFDNMPSVIGMRPCVSLDPNVTAHNSHNSTPIGHQISLSNSSPWQTNNTQLCRGADLVQELRKPKISIENFSGDPLRYIKFVRQFNCTIITNTMNDSERVSYLEQFTSGEAHKIVSGYSNLEASKAYTAILKEFDERYGNPEVLANAYIKKALEWPFIKPDDAKGLDDFGVFLTECENAVQSLETVRLLEYSENIKRLMLKLPLYLHDKWRSAVQGIRDKKLSVQFCHFVKFVRGEAKKANDPIFGKRAVNVQNVNTGATTWSKTKSTKGSFVTAIKTEKSKSGSVTSVSTKPCLFCGDAQHSLASCHVIIRKPYKERFEFLKNHSACFACLDTSHHSRHCRVKNTCSKCSKHHHTILHVDSAESVPQVDSAESPPQVGTNCSTVIGVSCSTGAGNSDSECTSTMAIIPVLVKGKNNILIETYAFLDPGSNVSFCTEKLAQRLGVTGKKTSVKIDTMGNSQIVATSKVSGLELCSHDGNECITLPTLFSRDEMPVTTCHRPTQADISEWEHLHDLEVLEIDAQVEVLIGNNVPDVYAPLEVRTGPRGSPHAIKSVMGWIFWNVIRDRHVSCGQMVHQVAAEEVQRLEELVKLSMNLDFPERCIDTKNGPSFEDKLFTQKVSSSLTFKDGHYCMDLPFRNESFQLPNNRSQAANRLVSLKRKMMKNEKFASDYRDFMSKMLDKGYAVKVSTEEVTGRTWYIPHHGVYHPRKPNKIRVVFDCSARYFGTSLNDALLQGPNLTNTIVNVLLRFREESTAMMSDIEGMFHQVRVSDHHTDCLRFLWWPDGDLTKTPEAYKMVTHLFGAVSSPACANVALRQAAEDNKDYFEPDVVQSVAKSFYVDDYVRSVKSDRGVKTASDVTSLVARGGFRLTGWISNDMDVNRSIPETERAKNLQSIKRDLESINSSSLPTERTLGVVWMVNSDSLGFALCLQEKACTRRGILSVISSVYDPLGIAAPFVLPARILLQNLCQQNLGWDEEIGEENKSRWRKWLVDILQIEKLTVPRCVNSNGSVVTVYQLHAFSDASDNGYGIAIYTRLSDDGGHATSNLLLGKSRVAPLKKISIPRMELTAASIAVKFVNIILEEMNYHFDSVVFWTDSQCVLSYISNRTSRFKTFVANRLTTIHEGSIPEQWRYVSSKSNPADIASRGIRPNQHEIDLWLHGPSFLTQSESAWPDFKATSTELHSDDPEVKITATVQVDDAIIDSLLSRFSTWSKLKTTVAWLLRGKHNLRQRLKSDAVGMSGDLTAEELDAAELAIVQYTQRKHFPEDLSKANAGVLKLDPFKDKTGMIRVGGRLSRADVPLAAKHPILLPKDSVVSRLLLEYIHKSTGHLGSNTVLTRLRRKYWMPRGSVLIRSVISKCLFCRRYRARLCTQKMADLPDSRLKGEEPPFHYTGIDFFGPFLVTRGRSRSQEKRYGVLFTCFAIRAIHLEVAHSLDTNSCINAIRRFLARRGPVKRFRSDNGTNLVGARRELKEEIDNWNQSKIKSFLAQEGIQWDFNPPTGSHHGGVWERLIRIVRKVLCGLMNELNVRLTDEALQTLFCEVESIVNSRPITKLSTDVTDPEPLTPANLLLLHKTDLGVSPPGVFSNDDNYARRRWRHIQHLANLFWKRWSKEYLTSLQQRAKWLKEERNVKIGDIVLVVDSSVPRNNWPLGRVVDVVTDKHGLVRVVKVKTKSCVLQRPITKLCTLLEAE